MARDWSPAKQQRVEAASRPRRLIFNDDISQTFDPPKTHVRSETVDSQRGEVEWQGGNLYFDQWTWHMDWSCTPVKEAAL